jgi:cytochrome c peroxidase
MRFHTLSILLVAMMLADQVLAADALMTTAQAQFKPIPLRAPELPQNAATPAKVELGKMLFFDPRLSASHSISCNSCHNVGMGGVDSQETSIGHHWQRGGRNSPTVFNAVFNTAQFWDGRAKDLEAQAGGPMANPIEMASPAAHVAEQLAATPGYVTAFQAAFPHEKLPVTLSNSEKAIAVFEATLITPNAPFDRYLKGDVAALNATQKLGLKLFMDKGCASCHNGVNVGGGMYAKFGLVEKPSDSLRPPADKGRFAVTKTASDEYVYKVPTLRNIALTAPYFHSGKVWDLSEAVAIMGSIQLGAKLSKVEVEQIVAFLGGLTGVQPKVVYPMLPAGIATTPQPDRQ